MTTDEETYEYLKGLDLTYVMSAEEWKVERLKELESKGLKWSQ